MPPIQRRLFLTAPYVAARHAAATGSAQHSQSSGSWTSPHMSLESPSHHHQQIPPIQQQHEDWTVLPDDNNDDEDPSSWQEEAHWMSFRNAIQSFTVQQQQRPGVVQQHNNEQDEEDSLARLVSVQETTNPLATDLAETRMQLALAQAERDEMEFALIQNNNNNNTSSSPRTTSSSTATPTTAT